MSRHRCAPRVSSTGFSIYLSWRWHCPLRMASSSSATSPCRPAASTATGACARHARVAFKATRRKKPTRPRRSARHSRLPSQGRSSSRTWSLVSTSRPRRSRALSAALCLQVRCLPSLPSHAYPVQMLMLLCSFLVCGSSFHSSSRKEARQIRAPAADRGSRCARLCGFALRPCAAAHRRAGRAARRSRQCERHCDVLGG